ncbi:MAG TPA: hypothetical protein VJ912_00915 [Candidatus Nanoarchaeia archaeon]|nr:hypothetical protein [Candidatus Nanoarchaeia archaeon]
MNNLKKLLISGLISFSIFNTSFGLTQKNTSINDPYEKEIKSKIQKLTNKYPFFSEIEKNAILNYSLPVLKNSKNKKPFEFIDKTIEITGEGYAYSALKYAVPYSFEYGLINQQYFSLIKKLMKITNNNPNFVFQYGLKSALNQYKKDKESLEKTITGLGITSKYLNGYLLLLNNDLDKLDFSQIHNKESFANQYSIMLNKINKKTSKNSVKGMAHGINEAHQTEADFEPGKDKIRKIISKKTDFKTKYSLIAKANKQLFTTSFFHLYNNFPKNPIDSIKSIDPDKTCWGKYLIQMGSMSKAKEILGQNPGFFFSSFKKSLNSSNKDKPIKTIQKGIFLTNSLLELYKNPEFNDIQKNLEKFLLNNYNDSESITKKSIYGYFIKHNSNPIFNKTKKLQNNLPRLPSPEVPKKFLKKDTIAMKSYYYKDEDWFNASEYQYTRPPYNMKIKNKTKKELTLEKKLNNKTIQITLTKNKSDVMNTIKGNKYDIISHRGHSYHLEKTFSSPSYDSEKILYLGSCNSFRSTPEIQSKYPNCFLISEKNTGTGSANNKVGYEILKRLSEKKSKWKELKSGFADKKGIIFPHEKNQLILKYIESMKNINKNTE